MKKTIIMIAIIFMNCGMLNAQDKGIFTDTRDGKTYQTVKIGNQVWMAENLAYKTASGCWYYDDDSKASANFGYLYDWETAKIAAPPGWHLPTEVEWDTLENRLGGPKVAALYLKSKSGWKNGGNGKNVLGFSAYPTACALSGGEDYELLFTVSQSEFEKIKTNPSISIIGYITEASEGQQLITRGGNKHALIAQGWNHLK